MKRGKNRSEVSIPVMETLLSETFVPLDTLTVRIQNIRLTEQDLKRFMVKVSFYDQLILAGIVNSIAAKAVVKKTTIIKGSMNYDPSDYERMSLLVDNPLCVTIQPVRSVESSHSTLPHVPTTDTVINSKTSKNSKTSSNVESLGKSLEDVSACNVDILPLFIDQDKMRVSKRMEPLIKPPVLQCKSWDNLPLLTMQLTITRDPLNEHHHNVLKRTNYMKMTLIGSYNMLVPYADECVYTAASKMPVQNETNLGLVMFNHGYKVPKRFKGTRFYPKWESLRVGNDTFAEGDERFEYTLEELQNNDHIPIESYVRKIHYTTVWASFHRTLLMEDSETWLREHLRQYYWPLELHIYGDSGGYSFMAFLNLFRLLYPGEDTVRMAVPLHWMNADIMQHKCGCEPLLTPNEKASSVITPQKGSKSESGTVSGSADHSYIRPTGSDDNSAFVIVEVKLARPLKQIAIPPHIPDSEINSMLNEIEQAGPGKRECSGRGQLDRDWQTTINIAANSLRRVPYYGITEFCNLNRQLSETRTRVELTTSFWQDAAIYVNNNFIEQDFLHSDETFEEMLIMSHACLMKTALVTLVGVENWQQIDTTLRAARHARQMQDFPHALDLYLQLVVENPRSASSWRELATCLQDIDKDWANVCINKSVALNPRHHLSLLSKGCMLMEEDPALAEPFFVALLGLYPFWSTGWIITSVYYLQRELFHMADAILEYNKLTRKDNLLHDKLGYSRVWEQELGDWWEQTPLLPGMSPYYDAADLLLRLRAITLAEACVSRALVEAGETAVYYHLVALCCRLRGKVEDALCHINTGIQKYGEISYLRTLEAECHHMLHNVQECNASFEKAGTCMGGFSILLSTPCSEPQRARTVLVDLVRRQPSAYGWMALADDWMNRAAMGEGGDGGATTDQVTAKSCAAACCVQALKLDRRAARAWALLAKLVRPSARRLHCLEMAKICGYEPTSQDRTESKDQSRQSLCHLLGKVLRECRCELCQHLQL